MKFAKLNFIFAFAILAILSLAFTSAQVLTFTPSSQTLTVNSGQSVTLNFNLTYSGSSNSTTLTWASSSSNSLVTIMLPQANSINQGQSLALSSTITVSPSASGTITAIINVSSGTGGQASLPITLNVNNPQSSNLTISTSQAQPINVFSNLTLSVRNTGSSSIQNVLMSETGGFGMSFNPQTFSLGGSSTESVIARFTNPSNIKFGVHQIQIKADAGSQSTTQTFQVRKSFCSAGTVTGNLTIDDVNWENNGEGDEDGWELLDEIEVEVKVQNNNNEDNVDVIIELGLFDSSGNNVADDLIYTDESDSDSEEIEINIDEDSDEEVKWVFKVPADIGVGDYKLAIKAYDDDAGQSKDCDDTVSEFDDSFFQAVKIEEASDEGRFVVVDEIEFDSQVTCGSTVAGQFTVFNIGEDDQDRVRITIRNQDLGINLVREITSDLDKGDDEALDFSFQVPATSRNGNYILEFITEYDYKNGVYREESEDTFDAFFEVLGCSENLGGGSGSGGLTNIRIDAELDSDPKAGELLEVFATISNTGTQTATYSLSARGYSDWASLEDISDASITLDEGDSAEVVFTLKVNKNVVGTQSFDIQVTRQDGRTQIQEVEVKFPQSSVSGLFSSGSSLIWIIGAINLILIILIIVVAVRVSRR